MLRYYDEHRAEIDAWIRQDNEAAVAAERIASGRQVVPLEDEQPELTERLRRRYAERWVVVAHLRPPRLEDAKETIELKVAPDEEPGLRRLRLRSFLDRHHELAVGLDGSEEAALDFIDEAADLQGQNVGGDRRHGPVLWDDVARRPRRHS